jgi:hypothetical protein
LCDRAAAVLGLLIDGGYATHVVVPQRAVYAVPDALPAAQAAILHCTYGTAYRGMVRWGGLRAGANDNASAVAAMLQAAETLNRELPDDTELWVVATGAEEIGSRGMQAFMNRHPHWPRERCLFINFESVGSTHLHFAVNEGASKKTHYSDASVAFTTRLAERSSQAPITPIELMIGTDGRVPARRGYEAVSLVSLEANQVPRNYHRPNDIAEYIDLKTVQRAGAFAIEVAQAAATDKKVG